MTREDMEVMLARAVMEEIRLDIAEFAAALAPLPAVRSLELRTELKNMLLTQMAKF